MFGNKKYQIEVKRVTSLNSGSLGKYLFFIWLKNEIVESGYKFETRMEAVLAAEKALNEIKDVDAIIEANK